MSAAVRFAFTDSDSTQKRAAVDSVLKGCNIKGVVGGELPTFKKELRAKRYQQYHWPRTKREDVEAPKLFDHLKAQLAAFGVPFDKPQGFRMLDVHVNRDALTFDYPIADDKVVQFAGGTDAVVYPYNVISWHMQLRVVINWKTPKALTVDLVDVQAKLELLCALSKSNHPALVVFTDDVNFIIYQPFKSALRMFHTLQSGPDDGRISVDEAVRFIAHYLKSVCSREQLFDPEDNTAPAALKDQIAALLAMKKRKHDEVDALADQLAVDEELPTSGEQFAAMYETLSAWKPPEGWGVPGGLPYFV
ncbi:hypothetical protein JKP88DRAFT_199638 [Tribonema minus]|uniref:Uncharacterized protein n=1 Tax=Tribonema minus TaxID=303371 RepID=A0A836CDS0_9STRA|nr:hypothetical protein JKP88DRAFT_199638 [Tribonema minus]